MLYSLKLSQDAGGIHTLIVSGALTVHHAQALKQELLDYARQYHNLRLLVKDVTDLDVTFLQLLLALGKYQDEQKKPFYLQLDLNPQLGQLLHCAGLDKSLSQNSL